ncbi:Ldh family oxidoreductase [Conexibacter sp. CPCC 206217]|uniref:Ldh family oxidoreductase n=1 Tax=Conexibacter sp. CPCC 206217 TaxID=3064574 RepID=UPI002720A15B|nr:Ldh family oxidoreductase [Conexibacter sp. CPCC 206217]MDO8208819.1 Ldh family oxidoreductase [Conexibacter sp. CPCC 206217]
MPTIDAAALLAFSCRVLRAAGMPDGDAEVTAGLLVEANLRGVDSHGVLRLIQYADSIAAGDVEGSPEVRVLSRTGSHALVDAGGGYGFVPTTLACDVAGALADEHGVGVVGVRDSHHFGMGGPYARRIAAAGNVGMVLTNAGPAMAPAGVRVPVVGNNPLAIAAPRRAPQPPLVLDMALSQTAFGRVRLAAAEGREIPLGWALDSDGQPTTDARRALEAQLLAPVGGHKGLGLALMLDVLAGALTGSPVGADASTHGQRAGGVGHLVLALSPQLFVEREAFLDAVERFADGIKLHDGPEAEVLLPGERGDRSAAQRRADGVDLSAELALQLDALARRLGVDPLVPAGGA